MRKYKNIDNGKSVVIINDKAAGMCNKTRGMTIVIFKYKEENNDFLYVMEHKEFYNQHTVTN